MLGLAVNVAAAALLAFTIFFYVIVYAMWLKRRTPQNIVIGGAASTFPLMISSSCNNGGIEVKPLILFTNHRSSARPSPTSRRCRSIIAGEILPCQHPHAAGLGSSARLTTKRQIKFTASCWCRFRSCPGHSDLREQSASATAGDVRCDDHVLLPQSSLYMQAMAPKSAPLPACSRFRFFTCSCSSPRY